MARSNVPFLEDESTDIALSKTEFVEEKRKKKKASNKIHNSPVEERVQEMMIEGLEYSKMMEILKEEYGFIVGYPTLNDYYEFYFKDLENKAVQIVKEKLLHHLDIDNKTVETLYAMCATHIEFLHKEFNRVKTEIEGYREELEGTVDSEDEITSDLSFTEKSKLRDVIHNREKVLLDLRQQIADKLEGPQGFILNRQAIAKEVLENVLKIMLHRIPKEEIPAVRVMLGDFMKRYEDI